MSLSNVEKQVEIDRQRLLKEQQAKEKRIENEVKRDYEKLKQQQTQNNLVVEHDLNITKSTMYINNFSYTNISSVGLGLIGAGTLGGISTSATLGGIGLVGQFGGIGIGFGAMTGVGAIMGAATYGAYTAIEESDTTVLGAIGLGTLGGVGLSATVGGMGLSVGGTAFGIGIGSMAVAVGFVGLGMYGLTKILTNGHKEAKMYRNLYYLEEITREYEEERKWRDLESGYLGIEAELQALKASLKEEKPTQKDWEYAIAKNLNENLRAATLVKLQEHQRKRDEYWEKRDS